MGKPDFDIVSYLSNQQNLENDFFKKKLAIDELRKIIRGDIASLEIKKDKLHINLRDGRKYNWRMNSVKDNNFTVLTHTGEYENKTYKIINKLIKDSDNIIDVGANKGWYSVLFGKLANHGLVYAVEPTIAAYCELKENIKINNLKNVIACNLAFSNYIGRGFMSIPYERSSLAYLVSNSVKNEDAIRVTTIDQFIKENQINKIDLIKIDAEGSEYDILTGAESLLTSENAPILIIEAFDKCLLRFGKNTGDLIHFLKQCGYKVYNIETLEEYMQCVDNLDTDFVCFKNKLEDMV